MATAPGSLERGQGSRIGHAAYCFFLNAVHRFFCASAILFRAAALMRLLPRFAGVAATGVVARPARPTPSATHWYTTGTEIDSWEMYMQTNAFDALYVPANDTPWFPYGPSGCEAQLIKADPTTGQWIAKLRGPAGAGLGIHRHYGSVIGFTLRGGWRYLEHDWISRNGDIVQETPGSVHTLVLQDDSEILFIIEGALEYLDDKGHTLAHEDWKSILQKHVDFCVKNGISATDVTRPRIVSGDRAAVA